MILCSKFLARNKTWHLAPEASCRDGGVGLRTVRLTGTAVRCLVRNGYGFTVHRPSNCVSKEPTETNGNKDGRIRGYGLGRVKKIFRNCLTLEVSH